MTMRIQTSILLAIFASTALAQESERVGDPIIDVHVHVYEKDGRWTHKVLNLSTGQPMIATSEPAHMQATLEAQLELGRVSLGP